MKQLNLALPFTMHWNNYSAKCRKVEKNNFLPKKNSLPILNGICIVTVKVLPKNNLTGEWNTGMKYLSNYYDKYINSFNKIVAIERNIRNVVVKDVPLKGKLDKLEFDGKSVNVVDYKTGILIKPFQN